MKLSVIIVSYNTKDYLKKALNSVPWKKDSEIFVVDNASTDSSSKMVKKEFPEVKLIVNSKNVGFAGANNIAIKKAKGKNILLLNSDAILLSGASEKMMELLQSSPEIGIVSGQLLNEDNSIQPQGGYLPNLLNICFWMLFLDDIPILKNFIHPYQMRDKKAFTKKRKIGWVGGTAMMIKKEVFDKVGVLNEDFFMYGEDVEFCMRIKKAGYSVMITPDAKITHFGYKSSKGSPSQALIGEYKAIKYIFQNYKPAWQLPIIRLLLKTGALLRMLVFGILLDRKEAYATYKKAFQVA